MTNIYDNNIENDYMKHYNDNNYDELNNTTSTVNEVYNGGVFFFILLLDVCLVLRCLHWRFFGNSHIERRDHLLNEYEYKYNNVKIIKNICDEDCSICLEKLFDEENNKQVISLECNHLYHKECVDPWIKENKSCPLCKRNI